MHPRAYFAAALLSSTLMAHAAEPASPEPAQQLVADVIYNELHDRECDSFWRYRSVRHAGEEEIVREQVETSQGPVYRVLEDHGAPLDLTARAREDRRIQSLLNNPTEMQKVEQKHIQSEDRLRLIMELLPKAFLFHYEGPADGDMVRIAFLPDPSFRPEGYEARVVHAMGGTLIVNRHYKRIVQMEGHILERVTFGYGVLGYVEKGGSYEIRRVQVDQTHWKTRLVEVHVSGRILLFENVDKEQRESRSDFYPVPQNISLNEAKSLLDMAAEEDQTSLSAKLH